MSHEIFGTRFISFRAPAWHRLGQVVHEEISAITALKAVGEYTVELRELVVAGGIPAEGYRAIVRNPTHDDPKPRIFGVVSDDYTLVTPQDVCRLWDEHVGEHIETLGVLKKGASIFITTKLDTFSVKGDPCESYLLLHNGMDGKEAVEIVWSPVRVVCQNTLRLARQVASDIYYIRHDRYALVRLAEWLGKAWAEAKQKAELGRQAFELMANRRVTRDEVQQFVTAVYPLPNLPKENAPPDVLKARQEAWEIKRDAILQRRTAVTELFNGAATGAFMDAMKGTAWGLYNSVVELEDYRRGKREASAADALFGFRAATKERAFTEALELARN
jgi:phage/plasmid-like protein (TIGR03299 family)